MLNWTDKRGGMQLPDWAIAAIGDYIGHTVSGISIRDLARRNSCHASTVSRRVRKIERLRDDPLIDAALQDMEAHLSSHLSGDGQDNRKDDFVMSDTSKRGAGNALPNFEQEAKRILRRLCEAGSVLAIAADMDTAVVVREGPDGSTARTGVVSQEIAQAMALNEWIETDGTGRILRYRITQSGRDKVRDLLEQDVAAGSVIPGMAEAPATFDGAPAAASNQDSKPSSGMRRNRYALAESPLSVLARRRDKDGKPFLGDDLVRSGERLREDFELAQMEPAMSQNWDKFLTAGIDESRKGSAEPKGFGPEAARSRVLKALKDLGPGLSDVALYCCCYLEGLESTEKRMGWSARSGKIVLRIALQRLNQHYAETLTHEAQMIG